MAIDKVEIEKEVGSILRNANTMDEALRALLAWHSDLPMGVSWCGGHSPIRFENGTRSVSFSLSCGGDDTSGVSIHACVKV